MDATNPIRDVGAIGRQDSINKPQSWQTQTHHMSPHSRTASTFSPQSPRSSATVPTPSTFDHNPSTRTATGTRPPELTSPPRGAQPYQTPQPTHDPAAAAAANHDYDKNQNHPLSDHGVGSAADAAAAAIKKPRACEACRGLKVKCDPDPDDPAGPCRRCRKGGRECVVTEPSRRKAKKTDSRVTELEKKIDMLTAGLLAASGGTHSNNKSISGGGFGAGGPLPDIGAGAGGGISTGRASANWDRETDAARNPPSPQLPHPPRLPPPGQAVQPAVGAGAAAGGQKRKFDELREPEEEAASAPATAGDPALSSSSSVTPQPGGETVNDLKPDVIDRGLMTMELANKLFVRYTTEMCRHLPGVVLPPDMTASELRVSKPILFLAIMAAASSEMSKLQRTLTKEIMQVYADRVIIRGNKSLELVQAILVSVIWYWPPERFEELKFYQLVHIAAVMAIEIGLGRKKFARASLKKHLSGVWRHQPVQTDPTTLEARRAWLTCYFLGTNTAMALHRPNLIRWTPFVSECMEVLQSSPDAAPTDKYLCHLVWAHKLGEEIGVQFAMDEPSSTPDLAEPRTQYMLKGFERQLERYWTSIPKEALQPSLVMGFHLISLYMHEIVTQSDSGDGCRVQPPDTLLGLDSPIPSTHINALSACLTAVDGIFEVFLSLDVRTVRCLPVFNVVRVAYAVVVLIKIYFAASSPKSELGKVINKDQLKVEQYLDRLLEHFRATAAEDRSRPAAKFLVVLVMMRSWFHKQKQQTQNGGQNPSANGAPTTETPPPPYHRQSVGERSSSISAPQRTHQDYSTTASTPLQLLSEIATNNSAAGSRNADFLPSQTSTTLPTSSSWLNGQQMYGTTPGPSSGSANNTDSNNNNGGDDGGMANDNGNNNNNNNNGTTAPFLPGVVAPQQSQQGPGMVPFPGFDNTFSSTGLGYDYTNTFGDGDGFAQALNMTLVGFADGAGFFGLGDQDMVSYMMQDPGAGQQQGWYPPMDVALGTTGAAGAAAGSGW
ncbi:hypothetical protein C7999DRAFT_13879 [Corynascus novoguineensis]|uniref:Zn(2)-C6 fungal-type domain-containing protein n=1 Tax=Corynascus novoguineensis TaxID=1126955 RepID=A0AAN7CWG2_9PEZI|nr:hypothetical protein C7999DRAFT_13879 [Corynascus novoguineensis]